MMTSASTSMIRCTTHRQLFKPLMLITAASRPAQPWSRPISAGCRRPTIGPAFAIGKVTRIRGTAAKTPTETAYYLLSTALSAERFNDVARQHWGVENRLHWRLDVVMNEDQDRTRMDNGPRNLAILRHMALNVMQKDGSKEALRGKFQRAGWDNAYLARLLALF